jgi:hypothetical protein
MPEKGAYEPPDKIIWEEPEPRDAPRKGSKWDPVAKMLREHPGRWACLGRNMSTSVVSVIRQGRLKCFQPVGAFEVAVRNHSDRWHGDVYVRFVGDHVEQVK